MQKAGHLALGERIPQAPLLELTGRRHRRTEVAGERPCHRGPPEEAAQCRHVGQARGDGLCPQPDQEIVNVTGRDGGEPGHAVLLEVRREARELPHPLADGRWGQPAMGAQERGVLDHRRPRPRRRWPRHLSDATTTVSVLVGVQEDPNRRPHEARSTGTEPDDSVRHVLGYLRGVEGEREPELLRLEIARHPQPLSQMLRRDLGVIPLLDQALADPIDAVLVRRGAIALQPVRGKEAAEHRVLLLQGRVDQARTTAWDAVKRGGATGGLNITREST